MSGEQITQFLVWFARFGLVAVMILLFTSTLTDIWSAMHIILQRNVDKVGHFCSMFALTAISLSALPNLRSVWVLLGMIAISGLIELTQLFSARSADSYDFIASVLGTLAMAFAYFLHVFRKLAQQVRTR